MRTSALTKRCRRLTACSLVLVLASCGGDGYLASRKEPTEQERELRQAFVDGQPDLDRVLARQLLDFEIEPEDALRRQAYVMGMPRLDPRLRRIILRGQFVRGMTTEHVEASWGAPGDRVDRSDGNRGRERWTYVREAGRFYSLALTTVLTFENDLLIDIRESSR